MELNILKNLLLKDYHLEYDMLVAFCQIITWESVEQETLCKHETFLSLYSDIGTIPKECVDFELAILQT